MSAVHSASKHPRNNSGLHFKIVKQKVDRSSLPALDGRTLGGDLERDTTKLSFDPTGQHVYSIHNGCGECRTVTKWSWPALEPISRIEFPSEAGTDASEISYVNDIVLSRSADTAYVTHSGSSLLREWRLKDGKLINEFGVDDKEIQTVVIAKNAALIAVQSFSNRIKVISSDTSETILEIQPRKIDAIGLNSNPRIPRFTDNGFPYLRTSFLKSIALSPDGKLFARSHADATVDVYDVRSGVLIDTLVFNRVIHTMSFTQDSKQLVLGTEQLMKFDAEHRPPTPDFVDNTGDLIFWDLERGEELWRTTAHSNYVDKIVVSPNGKTIASLGFGDPYARLWNAQTGKEIVSALAGVPSAAYISFTPDNTALATTDEEALLRIHDIDKGSPTERTDMCPYTVCK